MNPDAGKTLYYFSFTPFNTQFFKGKAETHRRQHMEVTEVYVTSKDYREKKIGDDAGGTQSHFSRKFETPLKKVMKFRLQKYLLQSIFDPEGKHDWIDWSRHGGKTAKYIV